MAKKDSIENINRKSVSEYAGESGKAEKSGISTVVKTGGRQNYGTAKVGTDALVASKVYNEKKDGTGGLGGAILGNTPDVKRNPSGKNSIGGFGGGKQGAVLGNTSDVKRNPSGKNSVKGFQGGGEIDGKV